MIDLHRFNAWAIGLAAMVLAGGTVHSACGAEDDYQALRNAMLEPYHLKFQAIAKKLATEPEFQAYVGRLDLIDQTTQQIARGFSAARQSVLDDVLADIVRAPKPSAGSSDAPPIFAEEILAVHQEAFASRLPLPKVTEEEKALLVEYYRTNARIAEEFIADRGAAFASMKQTGSAEIYHLCVVMPFLHVPDESWTREHIHALPDWMKRVEGLASLQSFSLLVRRPWSAYQFSLYDPDLPSRTEDPMRYVSFLRTAAASLVAQRNFQVAIFCLNRALAESGKTGSPAAATDIRFDLARIYAATGHPQLAAESMKTTLDLAGAADASIRGKAAVLRMKYLYEARKYDQVVAEAPAYLESKEFASFEPQLMYVAWIANRQYSRADEANRLKTQFLERYPAHPLAADIYFADAMSAMESSQYDEARKLLEIVEFRFPDSRLVGKAKEIGTRLASMNAP